ncbi:metal ABC transporter substrate-binding protein [Halegenticoccus tardaugens]|uniref:metal ABC transporter substrate-binding protein n=1 Tax=Halegenticoccus tardaugens TaxID=2071624 RepID=UPI00100B3C1E|nr:zinc ABC transporter substrate-binding protein [Halegenticoccus tardaugens]
MEHTRRDVLAFGGAIAAGGFAGCLDSVGGDPTAGDSDPGLDAQTSLFVLYDVASGVGGDAAAVESVVPSGQQGHGWEPPANVQRDVVESDAFVYVGEGYQSWADDVVTNLESDGSDVTVIEASRGIDLIEASEGGHDHDEDHGNGDGHDHGDEADHDDHGHGDEREHDHGDHEGESSHDPENESEHDHEGEDGHGDEEEHDHDHGAEDPHFWLDPRRTKRAVANVRDGFVETDGENEERYAENADAYRTKLDELDGRFESALSERRLDVVLVAGHDAFGYLGHRYGFEIRALTGLAPDSEPSPQDIREAQELIDEHDIEYILAPSLESDRAANQLVAETDAKEALPIATLEGLTAEWEEKGWGYFDVMERVNLRSLRKALGAE